MPIQSDLQATLSQGRLTLLHEASFQRCRVTVTGIAGEFSEIEFKVGRRPGTARSVRGTEVALALHNTIPVARIWATAPEGVGALDITYEVRTRGDA